MKCPNCEEAMSQTMAEEGFCGYCGAALWEDEKDEFDEDEDEETDDEE